MEFLYSQLTAELQCLVRPCDAGSSSVAATGCFQLPALGCPKVHALDYSGCSLLHVVWNLHYSTPQGGAVHVPGVSLPCLECGSLLPPDPYLPRV